MGKGNDDRIPTNLLVLMTQVVKEMAELIKGLFKGFLIRKLDITVINRPAHCFNIIYDTIDHALANEEFFFFFIPTSIENLLSDPESLYYCPAILYLSTHLILIGKEALYKYMGYPYF